MANRLTIATALVAGLAGGLLTRYIAPTPVFAQAPAPSELRAQTFVFTNKSGDTIATFTAEKIGNGSQVLLLDNNGQTLWRAGGAPLVRPLSTAR